MSRALPTDPGDGSTPTLTPLDYARWYADRIDRWWIFTPLARRLRRIRRTLHR